MRKRSHHMKMTATYAQFATLKKSLTSNFDKIKKKNFILIKIKAFNFL